MSVDDHTLTEADEPFVIPDSSGPSDAPREPRRPRGFRLPWRRRHRRPKPRLRKLRFLALLSGLSVLALVSMLFGVLMSVARDLPQLENQTQFELLTRPYLYDDHWRPIGTLAPANGQLKDTWSQISQSMVHAVVAVEDKRFWNEPGVDIRGLLRALVSDVTGGPKEGASTIAEQFVKNVLNEQGSRTIFEKLREAALAFQLSHQWSKMKILTEYLDTIYFGNGAYGIESAARIYFGWAHGYDAANPNSEPSGGCGPTAADPHRPECADELTYWQAALLAGMVANPWEFDPIAHPSAAYGRRQLVLQDMLNQGYINRAQFNFGNSRPLPSANDLQQPTEPAAAPYFAAWLAPQIVDAIKTRACRPRRPSYDADYGDLKIRTTIDLKLQEAAQQWIDAEFPQSSNGPTATLVSIDNKTGEVRAMVSGNGSRTSRRPRSTWRRWGTANPDRRSRCSRSRRRSGRAATRRPRSSSRRPGHQGAGPGRQRLLRPPQLRQHYADGPVTLTVATARSDNSVFARVGPPRSVPSGSRGWRRRWGSGRRSPRNDSMILGGLKTGVSALDMAHAYETLAEGGRQGLQPDPRRHAGELRPPPPVSPPPPLSPHRVEPGPTGIAQIKCSVPTNCPPGIIQQSLTDHPDYKRVLPQSGRDRDPQHAGGSRLPWRDGVSIRGDPGGRRRRQDRDDVPLR